MSKTCDAQIARYKAIEESPEHKVHYVYGARVDTWKSEDGANVYVALIHETMTQGQTETEAVESVKSVLLLEALWRLAAAKAAGDEIPQMIPEAATTGKGEQG